MDVSKIKIEAKDVVKIISFALMLQAYYYATTSKIETLLIDYGYQQKKIDELVVDCKMINKEIASHEIKFARIFTMLYKDAVKPKQTQVETEQITE